MSRSSWKPLFINNEVLRQMTATKNKEREIIYAYNRATVLTKLMIGYRINIYNGFRFFSITVSSDMLGHRLGEFAPTRKKPVVKKDKKKVKATKK